MTATLQRVFDATKKDVEDILSALDGKVDDQFNREEKQAHEALRAEYQQKINDYKDRRYGGWDGWARWTRDLFLGLPDEVNQFFTDAKTHYLDRMRTVISDVAKAACATQAAANAGAEIAAERGAAAWAERFTTASQVAGIGCAW